MKYKEVLDDRFQFVVDFGIKIPRTYRHYQQIRDFKSRFGPQGQDPIREKVYKIEDGFTDGSLAHSSFRLTGDRFCLVAIFQVTRNVSCDEALDFMRSLGADLVGGQGTTLLWPQARNMIPMSRRVVSLDIRENLPIVPIDGTEKKPFEVKAPNGGMTTAMLNTWSGRIEEEVGIPYIFRYSGDDIGFHFDPFAKGLDERHCIACFKQES